MYDATYEQDIITKYSCHHPPLYLSNVSVVESSINLIQDEERSWLEAVDGEEKSQGSDCLLPTRQVGHGLEPLAWGHTVVIDALQVGLLGVLRTQECLIVRILTLITISGEILILT